MPDNSEIGRDVFLRQGLKSLAHWGHGLLSESIPFLGKPEAPELPKNTVACIELTECTAYRGSGCRVCFDVCPLPNIAITLTENLPQVLAEGCTGCNICVENCPTPGALALRTH